MAVAESLTNIAAADVRSVDRVVLSANWMAACGEPGEDAGLFEAVEAVAMELCPLSRHFDTGRQGLPVHEHDVARRDRLSQDRRTGLGRRLGVRSRR